MSSLMRTLALLSALAAVTLASFVAYTTLRPAPGPSAPDRIVHIADWHWVPEGDHGDGDYAEFLEQVDWIQRQQMQEIRALEVRQVWVEGQSDETIAGFRGHVLSLRAFVLPQGDSPVDQLIRDTYQEDLLQMGAAGRLLLAGEIDDALPLEDHDAWRAAKPVDGEIGKASNEYRERAMARRLPNRAVIVLGAGHDLGKWLPKGLAYEVVRVEALPEFEALP